MKENEKELFFSKTKNYVPKISLSDGVNFVDLKTNTVGHSRRSGVAISDDHHKGGCRLLKSNMMETPDLSSFEAKNPCLIDIEITEEESMLFGQYEHERDGTHILQYLKYKYRDVYDFPGLEYCAYLELNPEKKEALFEQGLRKTNKDDYLYVAFIGSAYFDQEHDEWIIPQFMGKTGLVSSRNQQVNGNRYLHAHPTYGLCLSKKTSLSWSLYYETSNSIRRKIVAFKK